MEAGLGHAGLRKLTLRMTGQDSLWSLGPHDLARVDGEIQALADEKGVPNDE
jgi:hypothetical protein